MIKQKIQLGIAAVVFGVACTLSSCSKEPNALPEPSAKANSTGVEVVGGRLVFADTKSFQKLNDDLWRKNSQELAMWEQALGFQSLRAARVTLDETSAPGLMMEFGFPMQYAALINPKGEYQIGDKIYWFHQGFKYEASSEEELQQIKSNPSTAKQKYHAGIVPKSGKVSHINLPDDSLTQNRTVRYNNGGSNGDSKYQYQFPLWYDNNSQRRLSFETFLYAEDVTGSYSIPQGYGQAIRSGVVLNEYYEYYSRGSSRWYRASEERTTSFDLTVSGDVSGSDFGTQGNWYRNNNPSTGSPSVFGPYRLSNVNARHSGGDFQTGIASEILYTRGGTFDPQYTGYIDPKQAGIIWNFEISGTYSAHVTSDPDHTHTESGVLW